ncbi:hypothetical protein CEP54_015375 [Fusarium duplospermum]|uniref:Uncharacterized protein n=1 Tax=Fusarium duplospermum TaxID=1325734 RepID=A0A428NPK5_9HYPO|nr:hypothetical protein CEP54_015375 [Fusarium duplospermum]
MGCWYHPSEPDGMGLRQGGQTACSEDGKMKVCITIMADIISKLPVEILNMIIGYVEYFPLTLDNHLVCPLQAGKGTIS